MVFPRSLRAALWPVLPSGKVPLLGAWSEINPDSADVQEAARHAVETFNSNHRGRKAFKLLSVSAAQSQVENLVTCLTLLGGKDGPSRNLKLPFDSGAGDQRDQLQAGRPPGEDQLPEDGEAGGEQLQPGAEGQSDSHSGCYCCYCCCLLQLRLLPAAASCDGFQLQTLLLPTNAASTAFYCCCFQLLLLLPPATADSCNWLFFYVFTAAPVSLCRDLWPPKWQTPAAEPEMHKTPQEKDLSLKLFQCGWRKKQSVVLILCFHDDDNVTGHFDR